MCSNLESSYKNNLNYEQVFQAIVFTMNPSQIVELGILEGFSLLAMTKVADKSCKIYAYDIFDDFNGNHAKENNLKELFKNYDNVYIEYGNFYEVYKTLNFNVDIIHIDIANNGDVYKFAIDYYMPLLRKGGLLLLEGGSMIRDKVFWMFKYNKTKIVPVINELKIRKDIKIHVIEQFPSLTLIYKLY